jgi:hypothetical protein
MHPPAWSRRNPKRKGSFGQAGGAAPSSSIESHGS